MMDKRERFDAAMCTFLFALFFICIIILAMRIRHKWRAEVSEKEWQEMLDASTGDTT